MVFFLPNTQNDRSSLRVGKGRISLPKTLRESISSRLELDVIRLRILEQSVDLFHKFQIIE